MLEAFYSEEAKQLAEWALEEQNRIKASKVMRIAYKIERRYRKTYKIIAPIDDITEWRISSPPTGNGNVPMPPPTRLIRGMDI